MLTAEDLKELAHLWDGSASGWRVLRDPETGRMSPFSLQGYMLLIEDDEMGAVVCQRMIEAGVPVIEELPVLGDVSVE